MVAEGVDSPDGGRLEYLTTGTGSPVSVFAHGLAGSIAETRPLGSGVTGTRAFFHFRGHGRSTAGSAPWSYGVLAGELRAAADHAGATRAVGTSMGAAALLRLLADTPDRFDRLVFFLPAVVDRLPAPNRRGRYRHLLRADAGGAPADALAGALIAELPVELRDRPEATAWAVDRASRLARPELAGALRLLGTEVPVPDPAVLKTVTTPALVVAQEGDPDHPVEVARDLAAALGDATLEVFEDRAMWMARARLRSVITGFLNP